MINKLIQKVPEINILLGGHDHSSDLLNINDGLLLKSGTDFREFSIVDVTLTKDIESLNNLPDSTIVDKKIGMKVTQETVIIDKKFEPHPEMK
jgi:hypothetical protein